MHINLIKISNILTVQKSKFHPITDAYKIEKKPISPQTEASYSWEANSPHLTFQFKMS